MKSTFNILLLLVINLCFAQTQVGVDINGESANDQSGFTVATSQLGTVVAIGAPRNDGNGTDSGHVRVYRNTSGTWTQFGVDINGDAADDRFGSAVAINSTGNTMVVGAPLHTSTNNGRVKVFSNTNGSNYTLVGSAIDGWGNNAAAGSSVAISANGSIIAIGAPSFSTGATNRGAVRVYQNISGTWTQIGGTIQGSGVELRLGSSVALSSDGTILAIGITGNGTSGYPGRVQIYRNASGTWSQIGSDIIGVTNGDAFGQGLSLSADGFTVAIGAPFHSSLGFYRGQVKIYQNISSTWTQVGASINGEANNDQSGFSVSLSGNGLLLAIGAPANTNANGTSSGHTRIYKNNSGTWNQIGADIDGETANDSSGFSVSISSDGNYVSLGAPYNDGNGIDTGQARVYNLTTLLSRNDFNTALRFKLYPNPVNDKFTVSLENDLKQIEIYNLQGQKVLSSKQKEVDVSQLNKGVYFVKVEDENGVRGTQKVIKE